MTPDKYLPHRYAGASGDFNPIHIDPEFAKAVGLPSNILHGLYSMGLVARANAGAGRRRPAGAEAALGPVPRAWARPSRRSSSPARSSRSTGDRVVVDTVAAQGENQIDPQRRGRSSSSSGGPARVPTGTALARLQDALRATGADSSAWWSMPISASAKPVASKEIAETAEVEWGASTVRAELAALEAGGYLTHPHTSAGRVPTDPGYRRYVDLLIESGAPGRGRGRAGAVAAAARGRRGDAGDDGRRWPR